MCCDYWTLLVDYVCPLCDSHQSGELQTHWLGELGGWPKIYGIGDRLPHLQGIEAATMGQDDERSFISTCKHCGGSIHWGARIEGEAVVRVWPHQWMASGGRATL